MAAMLTPTPMIAVSSGSPAAAREAKVTSRTTAAIATPIRPRHRPAQGAPAGLDGQPGAARRVEGPLQPRRTGVGEVARADLVGDGGVRRRAVLADRPRPERVHGARDLRAPAQLGHGLLDGLAVGGGGHLLAARRDEHDPRGRAVGRRAREALLHQVERLLRLDARHGELLVGGSRSLQGTQSDGGQHGRPDQGDVPAPPEGQTAHSIQESSHDRGLHIWTRTCAQTLGSGGAVSSCVCRQSAVLGTQYGAGGA
jgi:hypothetical protein